MILSFGDRKGFNRYYICRETMELIKRKDSYKIYRTLLTDGFVERYEEYKKNNSNNLELSTKGRVYNVNIIKSKKKYNQDYDDIEDGMEIILFPQSYYNIYVFKNSGA